MNEKERKIEVAEAMAINECVFLGKCKDCKYLKQCETDRSFVFPADTACMQRKKEIINERWVKL